MFVVYNLLLKVAEPISGPDRSGAVAICVNLRENGSRCFGREKETWKEENGSWKLFVVYGLLLKVAESISENLRF